MKQTHPDSSVAPCLRAAGGDNPSLSVQSFFLFQGSFVFRCCPFRRGPGVFCKAEILNKLWPAMLSVDRVSKWCNRHRVVFCYGGLHSTAHKVRRVYQLLFGFYQLSSFLKGLQRCRVSSSARGASQSNAAHTARAESLPLAQSQHRASAERAPHAYPVSMYRRRRRNRT